MPDWKAALAREAGPTYRFRGHLSPQDAPRTPLLVNSASALSDGDTATIRIYDPIDSWGGEWGVSAKEFASVLDQLTDAKEIRLHINSPGGEVFEAVTMMNLLREHPARVVATVDGIAASSASFLAAAADETVMSRNAELMIHDAWGLTVGNAADMRKTADLLDHISDNIASVYAGKASGDVAVWRAAMLAETWYSADDAVTAGLADRVAEPPAAAEPEPKKVSAEAEVPDGGDRISRHYAKRAAKRAAKYAD